MLAVHGKVYGRVQGVFFRDNTAKKAKELGVKGWVRNVSDGSVEVSFEGEDDKVEEMIAFLEQGPIMSRVDEFKYDYIEPQGYEEFKIV